MRRLPSAMRGAQADGLPVIVCHGLGGNGHSFDLPGTLGRWLSARGFEVFIPSFRGASLADWLNDARRVQHSVLAQTGRAPAWIGHSLGGLLPLLSSWRADCSAVVCLGTTAVAPAGSKLARAIAWARMIAVCGGRNVRLPQKRVGALEAPLMGRVRLPKALEWVSPPGIEGGLLRQLHASGLEDLCVGLVADLHRCDRYVIRAQTETLMFAGAGDGWAPPESVKATARLVGPHARVTTLSRANGHADDYGHAALLFGVSREHDVYLPIERFLRSTTVHPLDEPMQRGGVHDPARYRAELHQISRGEDLWDTR